MLTAVTGINWGDEGKGRVIDLLAEHADIVARYQGGNNAGHTVVTEQGKFILNLLPSGILHPDVTCVLGAGMVIDLDHLAGEMDAIEERGITVDEESYKTLMEKQRATAREATARNVGDVAWVEDVLKGVKGGEDFVGYESLTAESEILGIVYEGERVEAIGEGDAAQIVLTRTPFYAEMGGQVGDHGQLTCGEAVFTVTDTQKTKAGKYLHYGEVTKGSFSVDGQVTGGPAYYIRAAFKGKFGKFLATFFSVALILALGFMGNMVQSNSIGDAFHNAFAVNRVVVGVVIAVLAAFIFLGGVKRIAAVTEKLVPIMALFYIIGCVIILVMNASAIPNAFVQIFTLAFQPQAIAGGVAGVTVQQAMRYGVARGLFSNEAGLGSTPHAHALAKVKQPQDQGALAIIGVFVDTFVILTLTALVLITSGLIPEGMTGTALTQAAFSLTFGSFGKVFIAICMLFFAFSTILGWYFFGQVNFNALFGSKYTKVYSLIVVLFILIGSSLKVDLVWALADFFNGLMAVPNLLALLALSGVVAGIARNKKD